MYNTEHTSESKVFFILIYVHFLNLFNFEFFTSNTSEDVPIILNSCFKVPLISIQRLECNFIKQSVTPKRCFYQLLQIVRIILYFNNVDLCTDFFMFLLYGLCRTY